MISASHNPYRDNGIKLFAPGGTKLPDDVEERIEAAVADLPAPDRRPGAAGRRRGQPGLPRARPRRPRRPPARRPAHRRRRRQRRRQRAAPRRCFAAAGADVVVIHDRPDGRNINAGCGATDPASLAGGRRRPRRRPRPRPRRRRRPADRRRPHRARSSTATTSSPSAPSTCTRAAQLRDDTVVVTVMTNLGFRMAMEAAGINVVETAVGDRYVLEALDAGGLSLGGEQSGHVIFRDLATTGDGLLTGRRAVRRRRALRPSARRPRRGGDDPAPAGAGERAGRRRRCPTPPSARRRDRRRRGRARRRGRVLVRPSGTEPLVRVMVEAPTPARRRRRRRARRPAPTLGRWPPATRASTPSLAILCAASSPSSAAPRPGRPRPPPSCSRARRGASPRAATSPPSPQRSPRVDDAAARRARTARPDRRRRWSPAITARLDQLDAYAAELDAGAGDGTARCRRARGGERRARSACATRCGRCATTGCAPPPGRRARRRDAGPAPLAGYLAVQQALSALDRLEVRGRDSAGVHLFVWDHGLDLDDPASSPRSPRARRPAVPDGSVALAGRCLSFVYKAAAEIGELGDNTRAMRAAVRADDLLRLALARDRGARLPCSATPGGPASASSPSPTPIRSTAKSRAARRRSPYVVGALNGDVDNHADLRAEHELRIAGPITTDAKVIPALVARHCTATGGDAHRGVPAHGRQVRGQRRHRRGRRRRARAALLALRGSGQGVYIGLAEDRFVVASEPYGVVEETVPLRPPRRRARRPGVRARRRRAPARSRASAPRLRRHRAAGRRGDVAPPRSRRATSTAATTRTSCSRRSARRPTASARRCAARSSSDGGRLRAVVGRRALPADVADRLRQRDDHARCA